MDTPTGMAAVITALTTGLTESALFGVVAEVIPFVVAIIPFALGLYLLRKLVKGIGKGKVRF